MYLHISIYFEPNNGFFFFFFFLLSIAWTWPTIIKTSKLIILYNLIDGEGVWQQGSETALLFVGPYKVNRHISILWHQGTAFINVMT